MAAESSSAATAGRSSGGATAESYIGSLISLTSKSEIRYEGILYNINTEESSIGLRNVRSFGTEGRKKDGPQVPPSDIIYEHILFRGSDIKDLQVKSSPPVQAAQPAPPINSDPAIIHSHYSRPPTSSTTVPSSVTGPMSDLGSQSTQLGHHGSSFPGGLPLYQPGGNLTSWAPSPSPSGSGLAMPMYWQGFYGTPSGLPQMHQQSLFRPPPGLPMPPSVQQVPYSGFNAPLAPAAPSSQGSNLTEYPSPLAPISNSSLGTSSSLPASTLPLSVPTVQYAPFPSDTSTLLNKAPISGSLSASSASLSALSPLGISISGADLNPVVNSAPSTSNTAPVPVLQTQVKRQPITPVATATNSTFVDTPTPPLVTPGQLLQSGPASASLNQASQTAQKDVEVVQISKTTASEQATPMSKDAQPPILPLPPPTRGYKPNVATFPARHNYRGRGGRGNGMTRPIARFAEDFDFEAMNEKFNKDEVWGHLGKTNRFDSKDRDGNENGNDEEYYQDEYDAELPKIEIKPVYNKDDFFDSLSSNAVDNDPSHGRTRFSEQMKIDTETFGEFSRYRGGRGGRGPFRGGRARGSSYGRGYGYGYGYAGRGHGRGRGRGVSSRSY